jgi:hypothetical protein
MPRAERLPDILQVRTGAAMLGVRTLDCQSNAYQANADQTPERRQNQVGSAAVHLLNCQSDLTHSPPT